jgi:hypothetical protein
MALLRYLSCFIMFDESLFCLRRVAPAPRMSRTGALGAYLFCVACCSIADIKATARIRREELAYRSKNQ